MTRKITDRSIPLLAGFFAVSLLISACSPSANMLNRIPVNSAEVKVVDQNDNPVQGAQVESSNGRKTTTDENGMAKVRFGSVGVHYITVYADDYMPINFVVTMPADRGKTFTQRLTDQVNFSGGFSFGSANMYPLIFNYMFSSYGYSPQLTDYKEGQGTTWKVVSEDEDDDDNALLMSKAFLKKLDNGQEWWQISLNQPDDDESTYFAEILFSEDRSRILRYREKIGDNEPQEKPVSEGWYSEPVKLTGESVEGALKEENVSVDIPKGTFKADLLQFGLAPNTNLNIWRAKDASIPGGVIKYEVTSEGDIAYRNILQDYSQDNKTQLNSY